MQNNVFVFVVCGAQKHIDTLNFSLGYLRHFSNCEILVVSDLKRNEGNIEHDNILDIPTPKEFDNHQASIYLKVGLHKFVDLSKNYCYLDSDVVAMKNDVDEIFSTRHGLINFAADHCDLSAFSPNAMTCGCLERSERQTIELHALEDLHREHKADYQRILKEQEEDWSLFKNRFGFNDESLLAKYEEVISICTEFGTRFNNTTNKPVIKFALSHLKPSEYNFEHVLQENGKFKWDRKERKIYDQEGNLIFDDHDKFDYDKYRFDFIEHHEFIEHRSNFKWDAPGDTWFDDEGNNVYVARCDHLIRAISDKFNIDVENNHWNHWNGGVFLFDKKSVPFLDRWFELTFEAFDDPYWRTRDQGTLIATTWEFGLHDQKNLSSSFNFLADYNNEQLNFDPEKGFNYEGSTTYVKPSFVHVYHHFGLHGWDVWDYIENLLVGESKKELLHE